MATTQYTRSPTLPNPNQPKVSTQCDSGNQGKGVRILRGEGYYGIVNPSHILPFLRMRTPAHPPPRPAAGRPGAIFSFPDVGAKLTVRGGGRTLCPPAHPAPARSAPAGPPGTGISWGRAGPVAGARSPISPPLPLHVCGLSPRLPVWVAWQFAAPAMGTRVPHRFAAESPPPAPSRRTTENPPSKTE